MMSKISAWVFKVWGWKITGHTTNLPKKIMYVVMPHTSNWDFPVGIFVRSILKLNLTWIAKDSLFKPPHGFIFKALGGMGVDRSKSNNFVDAVVEQVKKHDEISLAIAPEGTRKKVEKLKSGFYWIAHKGDMKLILVKFDWEHHIVDFSPPMTTTGDYDSDLKIIISHFKGVKGKIPDFAYSLIQ